MARLIRNSQIETRDARRKLKAQRNPYWCALRRGVYLGYRTGKKSGAWAMRVFSDGKYHERRLAAADDIADSNGKTVLSFREAQNKVWQSADDGTGAKRTGNPFLTVAAVLEDYLEWAKVHTKTAVYIEYAINAHIKPALGNKLLSELTTRELDRWLAGVANKPRQNQGKSEGHEGEEAEIERRRRSSANRVWRIFRAALNRAWQDGQATSVQREQWERVTSFRNVEQPRVVYLSETEACALLDSCANPAFKSILHGALLTGGRWGELRRLRCDDFDPINESIVFRTTKGGKSRSVPLSDEGVSFFTTLTVDRPGHAPMFTKAVVGTAWKTWDQTKFMRKACMNAGIKQINFHALRHTFAVQLLQNGAGIGLVSELLGHSDIRLTKQFYGHFDRAHAAKVVKRSLPVFSKAGGKVVNIGERLKARA